MAVVKVLYCYRVFDEIENKLLEFDIIKSAEVKMFVVVVNRKSLLT